MKDQVINNLNLFEDEMSTLLSQMNNYVKKNEGQICALVEEKFPNWDRDKGIKIETSDGFVFAHFSINGVSQTKYYKKGEWL